MKTKDCVFCNFKNDSVLVYEDKLCYAIISKNPINKHHVLVIPKKHCQSFAGLPKTLASHVFLVAQKISKAVRKACKPAAITHISDDDFSKNGVNLVAHYKFHIIPRFEKDLGLIDWGPMRVRNLSKEGRAKAASQVKKHLK